MRSTIGIDVAAPAELVFGLARDVERWPRLLPHYVSATRLAPPDPRGRLLVRFVARRSLIPLLGLGIPVAWRSLTWAEPERRQLRFVHRGGATDGMDVTWRIDDRPDGRSRVEIEHDFRPSRAAWAWLIDRLFTRPVAGRTLATFRAIAEATAEAVAATVGEAEAPTPQPSPAPPAQTSPPGDAPLATRNGAPPARRRESARRPATNRQA
jgi:ribosome-associated toxin RatA of RatAB toxin-antitoxin module